MSTVSTYSEALSFLYSFIDYEQRPGWKYDTEHFNLDRYSAFLDALANPHRVGTFIHVAGTNGKGSVSAMIASSLQEAGLKTGLYTSPHLITFRERIRINNMNISHEEVVLAVNRLKDTAEHFKGLTFFEVWTALAFDYFARSGLDMCVMEVGLGGRLDSTNVIIPEVSVITSISIDHRGILGDTPEEIACEKAGIIKHGIPVISAPQDDGVLRILEAKTLETASRFIVIGHDVRHEIVNGGISYSGTKWSLDRVSVPLNGVMQFENASVALAALEVLSDRGFPVDENSVRRGIEHVRWPGRLQYVSENPTVIVDGACNTAAMKAVHAYVSAITPREQVVALAAMCSDKDIDDVLGILGKTAARFVLTQVSNPRAAHAEELAARSPENVDRLVEKNPERALERAVSMAGRNGLVIVTGSLYLVGEVLRLYGVMETDDVTSTL